MYNRYFELVLYKTYADLKAESERTYLGFLWWVFEPILFMGVFYVIFGLLMKRGTEDFVPFLLIGLTTWQWLKSCISHGALSITNGRHLMQRVHLPKVIFPIVVILTDSVKFVFIFVLLLIFLWLSGYTPNLNYWALPLVLFTQLLVIIAVTLLEAAIVPFVPDLRFVIETVLHALFFLTGIFFNAADIVPEEFKFYFYLNPMANLIEDYRNILMYDRLPDFSSLAVIAACSLFTIWLAVRIIKRYEYVYPRISI
ncbi:ABC transporter permease [Candidatus Venteria ishoeyi]|uniref:ABC transporter permease n=1 Tax=Candidatus Venteria ishoeyi TaxID=1899563 RepID=UPI0025A59182|nr:ABC transporter permease [Candidatus Venteria ishoeyi]MDM8547028.1 ABC transporter permease [Candidatus Venteria ishoeyi]